MTTKPAAQSPPASQRPPLTPLPDPLLPPDMLEQLPHVSRVYLILDDHYLSRTDVFVGGEGYLCYQPGEARQGPRPDCIVAFGVAVPPAEIAAANGYAISEIGKPPDFVLEVGSKSTGRRDYLAKREIYARFGVVEYWRFDHTGGRYHDAALAGDRLVNGRYEPMLVETGADGIIRGYSSVLELELHWHESRLRFWNPATGEYLPDLTESNAQRDGAERRAEASERRAEASERRAEASERRAEASERRAEVSEHRAEDERSARQDAERRSEVAELRAEAAEEQLRQLRAELGLGESES